MPSQTEDLSQGDVAYAAMIEAIRSGQYRPGDRLREVEISTRLGLSRTPIREAIRRLEADGIVEHRARIGAVIRTLSHSEIVELYEMRLVLERTAAELAAKHAVEGELQQLEALNAQMAQAIHDPNRAAAINQQFHQSLYHATRNRFLLETTRALNNALMLLGPTTLADEARITSVCAQHQALIDAVRAGDAQAAGEAAATHLETSLTHRLAALQS